MSSLFASIAQFFLSILSHREPARARVSINEPAVSRIKTRRPISKLFSIALPFVFALTLFAASPAPAHAAPTKPNGEGTFDCLGTYDWGCQVVGFLFDNQDLTYFRDGAQVIDKPGTIELGLRAMMAFFSNAMLIIAGVMLLYHLIIMVAETAHTGTIGGKETNQLWAPIRLIIAIGLLVPLSSGMNSGQYIVMQIAKWGSGLASQTWSVFAKQLAENSKLSPPVPGRIYNLSVNTLRTYMCMELINYHTKGVWGTGIWADTVSPSSQSIIGSIWGSLTSNDTKKDVFGNSVDNDVCGQIVYHLSDASVDHSLEAEIGTTLTNINEQQFQTAKNDIAKLATKTAAFFSANPTVNLPPTSEFDTIVDNYTTNLSNALSSQSSIANDALKTITTNIQTAAQTQGWTSAGAWFMSVARAQGQIISGGLNIPEATGPHEEIMAKDYKDAYIAYQGFSRWLEASTRVQDKSTALKVNPTLNAGSPPGSQDANFWSKVKYMVGGGMTIDGLCWVLDKSAELTGLWTGDPKKAFGDLGYSTNPFGEIAALGYKKVRAGLNYIGLAATVGAISGYYSNWSGARTFWSQTLGIMMTVCIATATLFLLAGVLLGFVVPLLPFIRFSFAIMTWIGTLLEAMICIPFFALAHLTPKGEGFAGPNARGGYYLIFQIFLRPVLTIFGLIGSLMLFYVIAKFFNSMYYEAVSGIATFSGASMVFMQKLIFSVLYAGLIYIVANTAFKMIDHIPKHAMRWMGGSAQEEGYEGHGEFLGLAGAVGGQQLISSLSGQAQTFQQAGTAAGKYKADMEIGNLGSTQALNLRRVKRDSSGEAMVNPATGDLETEMVPVPIGGQERFMRATQLKNSYESEIQNEEARLARRRAGGGGGTP